MLNFEIVDKDAVLLKIKPGKPISTMNEDRVLQKGQKGITCFYYAMNWIRIRYGKEVSKDNPRRKIEQLISSNRKKLTALYESQEFESALVHAINEMKKENQNLKLVDFRINIAELTIEKAKMIHDLVKDYQSSKRLTSTSHPNGIKAELSLLFTAEDLDDFLKERHQLQIINHFHDINSSYGVDINQFEPSYKIGIQTLNEEVQIKLKNDPEATKEYIYNYHYDALSRESQGYLLHDIAAFKEAELYDCKQAQFNFDEGIDNVMQILQKHGPIAVAGNIGKPFYKPDSETLKTIGSREFYAFPANSYTTNYTMGGHVIVLVGASRKGYCETTQDLIYYIDPIDESHPNQPIKIYVMSFNSFKDRINNQAAFWLDRDQVKESTKTYFFNPNYNNRNIVLKEIPNSNNANKNSQFDCRNITFFGLSMAVAVTAISYNFMCRP